MSCFSRGTHATYVGGIFLIIAYPFFILVLVYYLTAFENTPLHVCLIVVTLYILVCIGICAKRSHQKRSPLYAKDYNRNGKPWPGNWKAGIQYLVGNLAHLNFDGNIELKEVESPLRIITMEVRVLPDSNFNYGETFQYVVFSSKAKEILPVIQKSQHPRPGKITSWKENYHVMNGFMLQSRLALNK